MDNKVIQVILCFFIPPLAVYLKKGGIDNDFWINVVLTLLGGLPGLLHGLYVVLK
ncbi:MAG: YqaE/Pmp3 family membrane protein [Chloroflexi bacterium]|nr:YqaE/Pmp3 family membrane protein [Chloroflexota bacterium]